MSRDGHIEDVYGRACWCGDVHNWSGIPPEPEPTEAELEEWADRYLAEMEHDRRARGAGR